MKKDNPHIGSSLDEFFAEEGLSKEEVLKQIFADEDNKKSKCEDKSGFSKP